MTNVAFTVGRVLFGLYWLRAGFHHFTALDPIAEYARGKGTPAPKIAVVGSGIVLLIGGLSMILGAYPTGGIVLLVLFLLAASFHFHSYWRVNDAKMKQIDQINFMKNMALVGALLMLMAIPQPWPSYRSPKIGAESKAPDDDSPNGFREEKQQAAQHNSRYVTCPGYLVQGQ
jgi:putative oxidoreductase